MGSQLAGGMEKLKTWMIDRDKTFVQVPFPDGYKNENTSFDLFLSTLKDMGIYRRRDRRSYGGELSGDRPGFPAR